MLLINFYFYSTFAIFSVFVVLVFTEIMGSVLLLLNWNRYRNAVLPYIVPVWEVTGTFAAFWVVTSDFAYPALLIPLASIFSTALMTFLIVFVLRNATISFAEFFNKKGWMDSRKLFSGYALSTLLIGLIALVVLASVIEGNGINLSNLTFSLSDWSSSASGILFMVGALVILIGLAPIFYNDRDLKTASILFVVLGVIISNVSFVLFKDYSLSFLVAIPDVLTIALPLLFFWESTGRIISNKIAFIFLASVDIFSMSFMVYPTALGGKLNVDSITNSGPLAFSYDVITLVGTIILALLIILYATAVKRKGTASYIEQAHDS